MKILVTGGAGFIGSHLDDALIARGHQVTVVDNLVLGRKENIAHLLEHPNFKFEEVDILDATAIHRVFEEGQFEMVYHLAANSDIQKGGKDPLVDYNLTFNTTFQILQLLKEFGIQKFFFASTSAIYGETYEVLNEDYGPLKPVSNYGAGKLASEAFISAFSSTYHIQTWITRFPNVVGERFTHGVIYDFIHKLQKNPAELEVLGNGEQCKPYVYVKDLVAGILFEEIAAMVIEEMELNAQIRYTGGDRGWVGDVPEFRYDLTKVNTLGWVAPHNSNDSVRLAIQKALGK